MTTTQSESEQIEVQPEENILEAVGKTIYATVAFTLIPATWAFSQWLVFACKRTSGTTLKRLAEGTRFIKSLVIYMVVGHIIGLGLNYLEKRMKNDIAFAAVCISALVVGWLVALTIDIIFDREVRKRLIDRAEELREYDVYVPAGSHGAYKVDDD